MRVIAASVCLVLCMINAPGYAQLAIETLSNGLSQPVDIENAGDGSQRLFIVEKSGKIRIIDSSGLRREPLLNIENKVDNSSGEEGLLGLAFHPDFKLNGHFFVYYIRTEGGQRKSVVERYTVPTGSEVADLHSGVEVLAIEQPQENHNGGDMSFGLDGYLYIGTGDGGSGNDPGERSQDLRKPLGKLLRIDVDVLPYTIPPDNPFFGAGGDTIQSIWALGLRNPWRFSFDVNGDLWIGDVGQRDREEINLVKAEDHIGGLNYGWDCREGEIACPGCGNDRCQGLTFTEPVYWYGPGPGLSVTGGYVFRGEAYDALEGQYVFADFAKDEIRTLRISEDDISVSNIVEANNISSFGRGEDGTIYAANLSGIIYRLVEVGGQQMELIAVHLEKENRRIFLNWETGIEINASHFQVERSYDHNDFIQVGVVPAKSRGERERQYDFIDVAPRPGHYLYRLKAIGENDVFNYSATIDVEVDELDDLQVVPNPAKEEVTLNLPKMKEAGMIYLMSIDGVVLAQIPVEAKYDDPIPVDVKSLERGLVLVRYLSADGKSFTRKLMLY